MFDEEFCYRGCESTDLNHFEEAIVGLCRSYVEPLGEGRTLSRPPHAD